MYVFFEFEYMKMIRNYNKNGGSDVDLSPIYSQLNSINNWIRNADFDTNLPQSVVSLSNDFTNFTTNINSYIGDYVDENLSQTLSAITNSVTKNIYDISVLNDATNSLDTKVDALFSAMFSALNSIHSDTSTINANTSSMYDSINNITNNTSSMYDSINNITNNTSSMLNSINSITNNTSSMYDSINSITNNTSSMINSIYNIIENTSRNYTRITKLDDKIDDITSFTFDMDILVDRHDSSITKLNSSVSYLMNVINTNPQDNLIVSTYNKTMFSKSLVCYYNPNAEQNPTLWINDMGSYNSIPAPDQYISFYGAAISSTNNISLNMYLLNVTAKYGTFTINSGNIDTVSFHGGKLMNTYGLDGVFNSGIIYNGTFESFDHLLIQKYAYHNLDLRYINRLELFDNTKLFFNINVDNVWMFQFTNSNTQEYTQSNLNINNVSIVSLSNLGSISSVNINNVYTYILRNCNVNTCKINCTNTDSNISTNTQVGFYGNNISLLSANNIANNMESNTISTAVLEYNGFSHAPHKIIANSINCLYLQYYDYSMLEHYSNRIYDNTIVSLYLPVEANYYQTISDGTYDYSIINSVLQYFKSNNNISYIFPWFK